jgi:hypothetical protein
MPIPGRHGFRPLRIPRRLIPQRKDRDNYVLSAANGTTIPTYGWLSLSLYLGLRRNFTWRFVVTDVTHPLIGFDFLSYFGLLVDCKHNRLIGQHSRFLPVSRGGRTTSTAFYDRLQRYGIPIIPPKGIFRAPISAIYRTAKFPSPPVSSAVSWAS